MQAKIITALILIAGLINFLPIIGITSGDQLSKLYGISISDNNLLILLKHRALLFGIIGGFMLYAAFRPELYIYVFIMGFVSMVGFIVIALQTGGYNAELKKVLTMDYIALASLTIALVLFILDKKA